MALYYVLSAVRIETPDGPKQYLPGDQVDDSSYAYSLLGTAGIMLWPAADTVFATLATQILPERRKGQDAAALDSLLLGCVAGTLSVGSQANVYNMATPFIMRTALASGGASGTADYVTILTNSLFKFRVLEATMTVTTNVSSTVTVYSNTTGSNGTAYTNAMSGTSTGQVRSSNTSGTNTVAVGGALYAIRSDRSLVGDMLLYCVREV